MKTKINSLLLGALLLVTAFLSPGCSFFTEEESQVQIVLTDSLQTENTTLAVTNQSTDTVIVWLTLSVYTDTMANYYVQNVNSIFGITGSGAVGSFNLAPGDTLYYTSELAISGNLCFGTQALNCPSTQYPEGTNIFEFCLNNNATGVMQQESTEISCISGVHSFLIGNLIGDNWIVTTGLDTVRHFRNAILGSNSNIPGVFPTGCTNCTNQDGAQVCVPALQFDTPNTQPICIIQRPANENGGLVICTFKGFTTFNK